ncbi:MAG: sigma-70 family RNA polymerase sigma factor, partial [Myxococcota bacterium]
RLRGPSDVVSAWLVERWRQGDGDARPRVLELWLAEVIRWCRWNARAGIDPLDLAHDVMVRAADRLTTLTRPLGIRPWLWAITWRVLREHERTPWRRRWALGVGIENPDPTPSVVEVLEGHERNAVVRDILQALPLEERTLLWHAYVDRRTRAEIADLTGLSEGTVNRRLTQARGGFRAEADRRGLSPESPTHPVTLRGQP